MEHAQISSRVHLQHIVRCMHHQSDEAGPEEHTHSIESNKHLCSEQWASGGAAAAARSGQNCSEKLKNFAN